MRRSVLKVWTRQRLVLVAGLAVAAGSCDKGGGTEPTADYALSVAPAALTIVGGTTGTTTVTITRTNFTGGVTLSLGNAPAGVTGSFNPAGPTGTSSTLTVSVGAAVAPGVYNLTVAGTGTPGNRSTPLTLTVSAAPDYMLSLSPAALTIVQGANGNATVTITRTNFTDAVTVSLSGAPAGVTGAFNPAAPTGTTSTLTVSVGAAVAPGVYNLTVAGTGTPGIRSTPLTLTVSAALPTGSWVSLTAGSGHTCGLTSGGAAYCWGDNGDGQLGDGSTTVLFRTTPVAVAGGLAFASLAGGYHHICGLTSGGAAYCWGRNAAGALGDGSTTNRTTPVAVAGGLAFASLTAAGDYTCGRTSGGAAYCWGLNGYGQLGDGSTTDRTTPVAVAGGLAFASLTAGYHHSCGLTSGGAAYCWGRNDFGQLGDGSTTNRTTPMAVAGGLAFASLAEGSLGHSCGLTSGGAAYCWGGNGDGQLGDGSPTAGRTTPVAVAGGLAFASLTAGNYHTCGPTSGGASYCWGNNLYGQLGDDSLTGRRTPVAVAGGLAFASLTAGAGHTCGLTSGGAAYCWGGNGTGQLGDGSRTGRTAPVAVANP